MMRIEIEGKRFLASQPCGGARVCGTSTNFARFLVMLTGMVDVLKSSVLVPPFLLRGGGCWAA